MPFTRDRDEALRDAPAGSDWARIVRLLRYASFAEVAKALGTTPSAVQKWYWGTNAGPDQLRRLEELLGKPKEAAPQIEERLDALMKRDEVVELVQQVEHRVTTEVVKNREALVAALAHEIGGRVATELASLPSQLRAALAHANEDREE